MNNSSKQIFLNATKQAGVVSASAITPPDPLKLLTGVSTSIKVHSVASADDKAQSNAPLRYIDLDPSSISLRIGYFGDANDAEDNLNISESTDFEIFPEAEVVQTSLISPTRTRLELVNDPFGGYVVLVDQADSSKRTASAIDFRNLNPSAIKSEIVSGFDIPEGEVFVYQAGQYALEIELVGDSAGRTLKTHNSLVSRHGFTVVVDLTEAASFLDTLEVDELDVFVEVEVTPSDSLGPYDGDSMILGRIDGLLVRSVKDLSA